MLVLSRKTGESLKIGDNVTITVNRISGNRASIGIEAPASVKVLRAELENFDFTGDTEVIEDDEVGQIAATLEDES